MRYSKLIPCLFLIAACQSAGDENVVAEAFDDEATVQETESELSADWVDQQLDVQSEHPYTNNLQQAFDAFDGGVAGVRQFKVHFKKLDTESGYDFVEIYDHNYKRIARYSGKSSGFWTKTLTARSISFKLVTDKSKTRWGFQVDKVQVTGCTTKSSCGPESGWKCEQHYCVTSPCFNACKYEGPLCGTRGAKACNDPKKCIGGNPPADVPGECVPGDYCEYASDCSNLIAPKCWGFKWRCEENFCQGQCGVPQEAWNDCSSDADCARGEHCVDTGKRCITEPCYGVYVCQGEGQQEGETCGGIANLQCAQGLECLFTDVAGSDNDCQIADRGGVCGHRPEACIEVYKPVCGCDGQTYGNSCQLTAAGAAFAYDGECVSGGQDAGETCGGIANLQCKNGLWCNYGPDGAPRTSHDSKNESMCSYADRGGVCAPYSLGFCTAQYDPVCGCDGVTYSNDCARKNALAAFGYYGACQ